MLTKFLFFYLFLAFLAFLEIFVFYDYLISGFSFTLARKLCFFFIYLVLSFALPRSKISQLIYFNFLSK